MKPADLCREIIKLYKEARQRIDEIDPGAERLVMEPEVCRVNPDYCNEASSIIKTVYQGLQRLARAAKDLGLEETHAHLLVLAEHDWSDEGSYDPDTILEALPVLVEEVSRRETRSSQEAARAQ